MQRKQSFAGAAQGKYGDKVSHLGIVAKLVVLRVVHPLCDRNQVPGLLGQLFDFFAREPFPSILSGVAIVCTLPPYYGSTLPKDEHVVGQPGAESVVGRWAPADSCAVAIRWKGGSEWPPSAFDRRQPGVYSGSTLTRTGICGPGA